MGMLENSHTGNVTIWRHLNSNGSLVGKAELHVFLGYSEADYWSATYLRHADSGTPSFSDLL